MIWTAVIALLVTIFCTSVLKGVTSYYSTGTVRFNGLGGMPSMHSSSVSALTLAVYFETGFSLLFLVVLVFAIVTIRDAYGVRWEVSRHSEALNKLVRKKGLYLLAGHTQAQALAGVALGLLVTLAVYGLAALN